MLIKVGATQTGGSDVTLSPAGIQPGHSTFTAPSHSRLEPQTVDFYVRNPKPGKNSASPGIATTGVKISSANRLAEEGCCTVVAGAVVIDLGIRWDLSQPETVLDAAIERLRGIVYTQAFVDAAKKGVLPSA
jgi:hypothetical protein